MPSAELIRVWRQGANIFAVARVEEPEGAVEYITRLPDADGFVAKSQAEQRQAIRAALKAERDRQLEQRARLEANTLDITGSVPL